MAKKRYLFNISQQHKLGRRRSESAMHVLLSDAICIDRYSYIVLTSSISSFFSNEKISLWSVKSSTVVDSGNFGGKGGFNFQ